MQDSHGRKEEICMMPAFIASSVMLSAVNSRLPTAEAERAYYYAMKAFAFVCWGGGAGQRKKLLSIIFPA